MATQTRRRSAARLKVSWRIAALCVLAGLVLTALVLCNSDTPQASSEPQPRSLAALIDSVLAQRQLPEGWHSETVPASKQTEGLLLLVNEDCPYDPALATDMVYVYENKTESYLVKDTLLTVSPQLMPNLNAWMDAFYAQTGISDVNVVAGYRSYELQDELFRNAVESHGQDYASQYISLPGRSEHHTGLAIDLSITDVYRGTSNDFTGEGDYAWARENAWKYGFILRYPEGKSALTGISYESWHFRYVGLPHAYLIESEGLCLEEYIDKLRGYPFDGPHLYASCLGTDYEIYFCAGDVLILPDEGSYLVSGNNVDGYIVTIETKRVSSENKLRDSDSLRS